MTKCIVCGTLFDSPFCPNCGTPAQHNRETTDNNDQFVSNLYSDAVLCVTEAGYATTSLLQRRLKIGYAAAARLMDQMEQYGVVGPYRGDQPREVFSYFEPSSCSCPESDFSDSDPYFSQTTSTYTQPGGDEISYDDDSFYPRHPRLTIQQLDRMEGHDFEHVCADILAANGFSRIKVTQASGDYGIDVLAERDGEMYAIQCKCYTNPVGNHAIQEAYSGAAFYGGRIPVVMTNQEFTPAAITMATRLGVVLWGRQELREMLVYYNNVPLWQRILNTVVSFLIGSPSSLLATLACLVGLWNSFQDFQPSDLLSAVIVWFILRAIFRWIGRKVFRHA